MPIRDWVKLAVTRARATGSPAVFWLDETRAHDANLIAKVNEYLPEHDTDGLDIQIMAPVEAINVSLERIRKGEDTISVTGNVLRDYLTDLFPILELGTSAKMLSVVPADRTAAACSRPAPAARRPSTCSSWSRRTTCAGTAWVSSSRWPRASSTSPRPTDNARAKVLGRHPRPGDRHVPQREQVAGPQARRRSTTAGSHFYLALYWAQELAKQTDDAELAEAFAELAEQLAEQRGDDRRGAARRAGLAGRHRRLLPARRRQGRGRHAPVEDVQRRCSRRSTESAARDVGHSTRRRRSGMPSRAGVLQEG